MEYLGVVLLIGAGLVVLGRRLSPDGRAAQVAAAASFRVRRFFTRLREGMARLLTGGGPAQADPGGRRGVLKLIAAVGVLAAAPASLVHVMAGKAKAAVARLKQSDFQLFHSTCNMECLHCNLTGYVHNGKMVKIEANNDFNVKACLRGISRTKWIYHKDRLTRPLLRTGRKGSGEFRPISWDEALDLIVKNIKSAIAELGNDSLMLSVGSGNMDSLTNSMTAAFFGYLGGAAQRGGQLCCAAVDAAARPILGSRWLDTRDTIRDSRYLLCWGNNPAVTMQAYFREFLTAQDRGGRIVVIDPRFSETAAKADEWVPIVPGTDTALALGMMRVIIGEKLYDGDFLRRHTGAVYLVDADGKLLREDPEDKDSHLVYDTARHKLVRHDAPGVSPALTGEELPADAAYTTVFECLRREAEEWTPEHVQEVTEVPAGTVVRLARDFSKSGASMLVQNMSGAQRTEFGTYVVASQLYLLLLTGNIGKAGAGFLDAGGVGAVLKLNPPVPPAPNVQKCTNIPVGPTGEWIYHDKPCPKKVWWITTTSMMTQYPNTNMVRKALEKVPFVVVVDNLMTSTAKYADLVLPTCTVFEETSLMAGLRSHYVQLMEKAVDPPGEARPTLWILARLAERFGFGEVFNKPVEHYIETILKDTGITIEQLRKAPVKPGTFPWIPYKDGEFRTSTKKANFFVEAWEEKGFPPLARYMQVKESPKGSPELAKKYPLMGVQRKLPRSIHSSHGTNEWILEVHRDRPNILIHPDDARARGIKKGKWVVAFNDRGEHRAVAVVTRHIKKGVVCMENGWWESQGGSSSTVTNDEREILGNGHCCNSTLVQVRAEV